LNLIEQRFSAHQILKSFLFEWLGSLGFFGLQLLGSRIHLIDGILEILRELLYGLVLVGQTAARHALEDGIRLFSKLALVGSDGVDVVLPLFLFELVLVVDELVRCRNDFLLPPRERLGGRVLIAAATATT